MDKQRLSRRRLIGTAGTALSVMAAGCLFDAPDSETEPSGQLGGESDVTGNFPDEFQTPEQTGEQLDATNDFSAVYQQTVDSVAAVRLQATRGPAGGTAWVYNDEYLVTNEHVVASGSDPFVWFNDVGWREASIVGTDLHSDLAVLSVEDKPEGATPLPLVENPRPVGTRVAALGNPFGLTSSFTTGVISGRNRTIPLPNRQFSISDGIQTDAALNPGNSGGPLITLDGEVVGVVSAGRGDNTGFAISAAMARNVVPALIEDGEYEHSYLGILLGDVTPPIIEANDLPVSWGVYVDETVPDGPAEGILQGSDSTLFVRGEETGVGGDVIVGMDDWSIQNRERLSAFLALETQPGDTIDIEVIRDGSRETVQVTVGNRPNSVN